MEDAAPIEVIVWSDYVCPFCNVGRERAEWLRDEFGARIEWLPYDLHPEHPPEGVERARLEERLGAGMSEAVRTLSEEAGVPYNPHPERIPRSRRALETAEWARARGAHEAVHHRIMDAYWSEGRDISDWDVLGACVAEAGLDPGEARAEVEAGSFSHPVDASTQTAQSHGISAVPAFVLGGRLLVSGAHPHDVFRRAVERAREMIADDAAGEGGGDPEGSP